MDLIPPGSSWIWQAFGHVKRLSIKVFATGLAEIQIWGDPWIPGLDRHRPDGNFQTEHSPIWIKYLIDTDL